MSDLHHKNIRPLTGHFLGWGDDCQPHRSIRLSTTHGEKLLKVAKSLRSQIQDWQPGVYLTLLCQEHMDKSTGKPKIKVKQLLMPPMDNPYHRIVDRSQLAINNELIPVVATTKIRVCQGSSCRRRGSEKICQSMQTYLKQYDLTNQVQIESIKCLHQCKAAPHAIVSSSVASILPGKTHYRQLQSSQVKIILGKHFPIFLSPKLPTANLISEIAAYLQQHRISTSTTFN
jgi:Thioredoxin-like [2Fe-2S] ferredoxin